MPSKSSAIRTCFKQRHPSPNDRSWSIISAV